MIKLTDASTFDIMNVTECYCRIGSEFHPKDRMNINYGTNNYNEAFKEIVSFNKGYNGLPHNIKPYINHRSPLYITIKVYRSSMLIFNMKLYIFYSIFSYILIQDISWYNIY